MTVEQEECELLEDMLMHIMWFYNLKWHVLEFRGRQRRVLSRTHEGSGVNFHIPREHIVTRPFSRDAFHANVQRVTAMHNHLFARRHSALRRRLLSLFRKTQTVIPESA